ncbi:MAG: hypothetical protein JWN02_11 [Acidobacteria bacterium]|nr:hypothetical protein [Acidobacteriota bacterium]
MIFGMTLATFTVVHTIISLVAIVAGFVVMAGLLSGKRMNGWTAFFLISTVATSVTGFFFPFHGLLPPHKVGIISLVVLALAVVARYPMHLAGRWRRTYVISAVVALYLNFFVLIVQSFQKIPALKALAPKQTEPPFVVAQIIALLLFIAVGIMASGKFRNVPLQTA